MGAENNQRNTSFIKYNLSQEAWRYYETTWFCQIDSTYRGCT